DQPAVRLLVADIAQLVLGCGLGDEIVDSGFRRDRRRGYRIVAGDHHRLDAHATQRGKAVLDVGLHHVLEVNDAEDAAAVDEAERRAACPGDAVDRGAEVRRLRDVLARLLARELEHRVDGTLAQLAIADLDAGQPRRRRKRDESGVWCRSLTTYVV